jgi:outer membrane protein OmpA-like peptidoglycan-associated protein
MQKSLTKRQALLGATAALVLFMAMNSQAQGNPLRWETFARADDRPRLAVAQSAGLLVFMRRPGSGAQQEPAPALPADIFIDERLHTALLPGGFSEARVCPGVIELQLGGQATTGLRQKPSLLVQVRPGSITYIDVDSPTAARPITVRASADSDGQLLNGLRRQVHALSRLPSGQPCRTSPEGENLLASAPAMPTPVTPVIAALPAPPPVQPLPAVEPAPSSPAPQPHPAPTPVAAVSKPQPTAQPRSGKRRHSLSSEMLFRFGGYRVQDLTPQGHAEIVKLARNIREQTRHIQSVVVQGHTDPMGPAAANQRISNERAQTVRKILINSGLPARKIQAEGMGSSQLLVTDCKGQGVSRQDRLACNAPNRRVEILVNSTKD